MDEIDQQIIALLKENSRSTISQISKSVNLSIPAVGERIRKLEESELIQKYTILLNREKTKHKLMAFVSVTIDETKNNDGFRTSILQYPPVLECHHIAGSYDYLLKILVEDTKALERFITDTLKKIKGVVNSNTAIVLSTIKEEINP